MKIYWFYLVLILINLVIKPLVVLREGYDSYLQHGSPARSGPPIAQRAPMEAPKGAGQRSLHDAQNEKPRHQASSTRLIIIDLLTRHDESSIHINTIKQLCWTVCSLNQKLLRWIDCASPKARSSNNKYSTFLADLHANNELRYSLMASKDGQSLALLEKQTAWRLLTQTLRVDTTSRSIMNQSCQLLKSWTQASLKYKYWDLDSSSKDAVFSTSWNGYDTRSAFAFAHR